MIIDGYSHQLPDIDPSETREWIDSLDSVVDQRGRPRARFLLARLMARARELQREGRLTAAGLAAFEQRDEGKTINYSYELRAAEFPPALLKRFKANRAAWTFFEAQAPYYRRQAAWWVTSAKREDTRARRLATLIDDSAHGRRIAPLRPRR